MGVNLRKGTESPPGQKGSLGRPESILNMLSSGYLHREVEFPCSLLPAEHIRELSLHQAVRLTQPYAADCPARCVTDY